MAFCTGEPTSHDIREVGFKFSAECPVEFATVGSQCVIEPLHQLVTNLIANVDRRIQDCYSLRNSECAGFVLRARRALLLLL